MRERVRKGRLSRYGKEYGKYAACVISGFALYGVSETAGKIGDPVRDGVLYRNEYGGGDRQYELLVEGLENGKEQVQVTVPERKMSEAEIRRELPGIMDCLTGEILGENLSLSKVQSDLKLIRTLTKYGLSVDWQSEDPEAISDMGLIGSEVPEGGKTVMLRAGLMSGSAVTWVEVPVTVFPAKETSGEAFASLLGDLAEKDLETGQVVLPESFGGRTLYYRSADGGGNGGLIFLGIAAALCLFLKEKSDEKEAKKKWEDRMLLDYPELLSNFVVLTGAGYPVRQAWKKQVVDAESKNTVSFHPVYREMRTALNQMETGMPEIRAYGEFGRRIGLGCYIKFASLLGSGVSTGGKDLRRLLEGEMETAFRQRKELALRKGEEASTKLLIPMFLMLGVVMVMVVAPAFLSL